mmetsp:Transcript_7123/g.13158  ORF Transcript_7123/g.13158 Transcript_7123/m.13158 type:complete len:288 (+) Transcript_7123:55-918(+)|eukprot:CAMPEP_0184541866 /NCGR_PEP_ID=MMETSP0199_2-20130426/1647_1 /TAXON_ID=1112570 /ORGANISM="Thraustochytrium sp., Strain LLF1b" /LENGTH=287 /DNA_ID=CAMNT_0026935617 /DNA_START=32 /DNA_END=895 /DNA_ORIENTATION=+
MKLNTLKVAELREELEKRGLDTSGTKPKLLARLEEAIAAGKEDTDAPNGDEAAPEATEQQSAASEQNVGPAQPVPFSKVASGATPSSPAHQPVSPSTDAATKASATTVVDAMEEEGEEEDTDEDDGIEIVLRDMGDAERVADTTEMEEDKEDGEMDPEDPLLLEGDGPPTSTAPGDEAENDDDPAFKYSHGKSKRYPKLPGRAGLVNESNFIQYAVELGKRNTPFEVDLDNFQGEKPWTRFNSSLDDYFNFGLNEQTWKEFAARQVALRLHELEKEKAEGGSGEEAG